MKYRGQRQERAVNSLLEDTNADIYVTGSNSKLMSGEISTYLTGRYISIPVFTLSFAEYLEFKKEEDRNTKELLQEYIRMGGFSPNVAPGSLMSVWLIRSPKGSTARHYR